MCEFIYICIYVYTLHSTQWLVVQEVSFLTLGCVYFWADSIRIAIVNWSCGAVVGSKHIIYQKIGTTSSSVGIWKVLQNLLVFFSFAKGYTKIASTRQQAYDSFRERLKDAMPKEAKGSFIWKSVGFCINVHRYVWKKWLNQPSNMVFTEIFRQHFDEQLSCVDVFWSIVQRRALLFFGQAYIYPSSTLHCTICTFRAFTAGLDPVRFLFWSIQWPGTWFWMDFHRINRRKVWMETYWHIETRIIHPYWPWADYEQTALTKEMAMICNDGLQKSFGADGQVPWRTKEPSDVGVACSRRPGKLFVLWPFHVCSSSILHEYYIYIYYDKYGMQQLFGSWRVSGRDMGK